LITQYQHDRIAITFRGDEDPVVAGSTSPDFREKLRTVVGDGTIVCPASDHLGGVSITGKGHLNGLDELFNDSGDAFIIILPADYSGKIHGVIRTRDCGNNVGFVSNKDYQAIFGFHSSSHTEFGCNAFGQDGRPTGKASFDGPITQRVLGLLKHFMGFNLGQCHIFLGPSLGGYVSECRCYEYTELPNQPDGTKLIHDILRAYPNMEPNLDGLIGRRSDADKLFFDMGQFIPLILEKFGIPPDNIHRESNFCTFCTPGYHSDRRSRHTTPDRNERPNNLAIITIN